MLKRLIIRGAINILSKWLANSVQNQKLQVILLFLVKALQDITEILTDDNKDNSTQLEEYATKELPEFLDIATAFIIEKKEHEIPKN